MIGFLLALAVLAMPRAAFACATCVSSAYGDRTFNWAFLGLILMPFVVGAAIAGVLAARHYVPYRRRARRHAGPVPLEPHEERAL